MTAPSVTGSIIDIQSAAASGSQSVTVPADAVLCLVLAAYWDSGSNPDFSSLTLGGNAFSAISRAGTGTFNYSTAWRLNSPPTGSQTLAWTWSNGALSEGAHIYVVFLRDVDVSGDPVRGSSTDGSGSTNQTLTTGSFSTDPNDLVMVIASSYQDGFHNDINVDISSQTALIEDTSGYNNTSGAIGSKAGVSGTTTMSAYGDYPSCVGFSIKGSVVGGETKSVADSGAGSDATGPLTVSFSLSDSGAGADGLPGPSAALGLAETGAGSDQIADLLASFGLDDIGSGADQLTTLPALLALADSGSGLDQLSGLQAVLSLTDIGAGSDALSSLVVSLGLTDAATGLDGISLDVLVSAVDTGAGSEGLSVQVGASIADLAVAADAVLALTEAIKQIADNAAGLESLTITVSPLAVSDSSAGADALALFGALAVSDAGTGLDALDVLQTALRQIQDIAAGLEGISVSVSPLLIGDAGAASDAAGIAVNLALVDASAGADSLGVIATALKIVADLALGTDAVGQVSARVSLADAGAGMDALAGLLAALAVTDFGAAVDATISFDSATKIATVTFSIARRTITFTLAQRSMRFALVKRSIEFELN